MALASRGLRDMDHGPEALDPAEESRVRRQARRVHVQALAAALALTAVSLLLPA